MNALKANKFKVGDEVEVIEDNNTTVWFNVETQKVVGEIVDVDSQSSETIYLVKVEGYTGMYDSGTFKFKDRHLALIETSSQEGIKSDGGSSDYYLTKLPQELVDQIVKTGGIEIKDIARYVYDNNADAFNIIKAQKRIIEANKGAGKAGITKLYDANKIVYFANEQLKAVKREGNNE